MPQSSFARGGCMTARWSETLTVSEQVNRLLMLRPHLMLTFERLHDEHERRLPRVLGWGQSHSTTGFLDARLEATFLTTCTRGRGLHSSCWYGRRRR